jgi:hypothetical protein
MSRVGQKYMYMYTVHMCIYGIFGREIARYTVIYGVYIRFCPTLCMLDVEGACYACKLCS